MYGTNQVVLFFLCNFFFFGIGQPNFDATASSTSDLSVMTSPASAKAQVTISPDPKDRRNAEVFFRPFSGMHLFEKKKKNLFHFN